MRVPWSCKYLLLRPHVAHAPGSSAGSPFLSSAEAIAATISAFDFPFSTSFGLRQEDARKRSCGLRIKANGGADSGIPEFRSIGGGGAELWFNGDAPAVAAARALKSFNADPFIHEKPHERTALKSRLLRCLRNTRCALNSYADG